MDFDVIIIGAGPSGLTAALYLGRANLKTLILESTGSGGQLNYTYEVDNYPGFFGKGTELAEKMRTQALKFGGIFSSERVLEIKVLTGDIKLIKTRKNEYRAKSVIIATGAGPRLLGAEGEEQFKGLGVSYCATCDGAFFKDKTVLVAGGGNTAFEDALYLSKFCKAVYLIHRRDKFRASATLVEKVKNNPKIIIRTNETIEKIQGESMVNSVVLKNVVSSENTILDTSAVFVAAGRIPNSAIVKDILELDENGYIVTDENMRTSADGIYAVGDVRKTPLRQIITACADGAVAANDISMNI
ncbi:MAG: thioredoxin-disulfide reductase [Clostridia bacterium]|nr:thioredoxin-disulfide reductase [Clostridia bacterium]